MKLFLFFLLFHVTTATMYLNSNDFESKTKGKKAFVAFKAPWCGHCKKLKPDWDKLAETVNVLVGEVDCTVEKELCSRHGVQGYPTIKYSDGYSWTKYEKARDYNSLETFVDEELSDSCLDDTALCSEEELTQLQEAKQLNQQEIDIRLDEIHDRETQIKDAFDKEVQNLQSTYQQLSKEKDTNLQLLVQEKKYLLYVKTEKEEL